VFAGHVWMLSQTDDIIMYKTFCKDHSSSSQMGTAAATDNSIVSCNKKSISRDCEKYVDHSKLLQDYFQLSVNLQEMYKDWTERGNIILYCYC